MSLVMEIIVYTTEADVGKLDIAGETIERESLRQKEISTKGVRRVIK